MKNNESGAGEPAGPPRAAAAYIASLSNELAELARRNGLHCLGYILDMAKLEADQIAKSAAEPKGSLRPVPR